MAIERSPNRLFASLWAAWYGAVVYALAQPDRPGLGLAVLAAFFAIELPAVFVVMPANGRDTLSEIATWLQRKISPHRNFGRGWNATLLAGILSVNWLVGRTVSHYTGATAFGVLVGTLGTVWLWDHWVSPDRHG